MAFIVKRDAVVIPAGIPVAGTNQINIGNSPDNGTYLLGAGQYNLTMPAYNNNYSIIFFNNSNTTSVIGDYGSVVSIVPYAWNFIYGANPDNFVVVSSEANTSSGQTAAYIPIIGWPSITASI